jgi:hypothetical protein
VLEESGGGGDWERGREELGMRKAGMQEGEIGDL